MRILHANSSMPRAGSELLQCLLMQHPEIYASVTSPLLEYWYGAQAQLKLPEVLSQPYDLMANAFKSFCRAGTHGFYDATTTRPVCVDKSRGWLEYAELLWDAFPDARIVSMTRNVDDILASLDRIYLANPGHPDTRNLPRNRDARFSEWLRPGSLPLGLALDRMELRQAKGVDARIKYVDYNALVASPVEIMRDVFTFLGVEPIDVDQHNVVKYVAEDDRHYGIYGQHSVRKKVEAIKAVSFPQKSDVV